MAPEHHGAFTLVPTVFDPRRHDAGPLAAAGSGLDLHPDWCPRILRLAGGSPGGGCSDSPPGERPDTSRTSILAERPAAGARGPRCGLR